MAEKVLTDLGAVTRLGKLNPLIPFQLVDLLAKDLQKKEAPEAYLIYFLYDSDSNQYDQVKIVLSKRAENQHEELTEKLYISQAGYTPRRTSMEVFVAPESFRERPTRMSGSIISGFNQVNLL